MSFWGRAWRSFIDLPVVSACRRQSSRSLHSSSAKKSETTTRRVRVYTKTGDGGTSSLFNMQRMGKQSDYFQALGDVDELNAHVGFARENIVEIAPALAGHLEEIQSRLFDIGAHIATPRTTSSPNQTERTTIDEAWVTQLEEWIDEMDDQLEPLKNFILPAGGVGGGALHICRGVCRRAERTVVPLMQRNDVDVSALKYLNRLSDFFFVAARYVGHKGGHPEVIWKKPRKSELKKQKAEAEASSSSEKSEKHD